MANRPLHRFALLTAAATFVLLGMGGLVTSHGVGMAVPDWPNSYGYNMFFFPVSQWVGGIFYEHTHRLAASLVGLLTTILVFWLHGRNATKFLRWSGGLLLLIGVATWLGMPARAADAIVALTVGSVALTASWFWPRCEPAPKWLRNLGLLAFAAVVLQGILGGLRVVLFRDQIGTLHATLAQLFFALMCAIGLFTSPWWQSSQQKLGSLNTSWNLRAFFLVASLLIFCQLVLGAIMRHEHAGLAIPDFPLAYGKFWPPMDAQSIATYNQHRLEITALNPITAFQIGLQLAHRLVATLIFGAVLSCAWLAQRQLGSKHLVTRLARVWLGLIILQISLGAATIWTNKAADFATSHVLVGALSLALGANVCILLLQNPVFARGLKRSASVRPVPAAFASHPAPVVGIE